MKAFTSHHRLQQNSHVIAHMKAFSTDYNKTHSRNSTCEGIHQSPQTTTKPSHVTAHIKAFTNQHRLQQNTVMWQHTWRHSPVTIDYNKTQSCDGTQESIHQSPQTTTKHIHVIAHVKAFISHHRLQPNTVVWQHTWRHSTITTDYNKT